MTNSRHGTSKRTRKWGTKTDQKVLSLSVVRPVARRRLTSGTVCQARVTFADGTGDKVRPVVVVAATEHEITALPVTSSVKAAHREPHLAVTHLDGAGLTRRSWIRLRPTVIERRYVNQIVGQLDDTDHDRIFSPEQEAA